MKVLDLQCPQQHAFEGWFASEDDFQSQLARGLVECPLCASKSVHKMPSAPRLNLNHGVAPVAAAPAQTTSAAAPAAEVVVPGNSQEQAMFLHALRHVVANTENVGERFADEARRMHYGEAEPRSIRGQASPRQTRELIDEGIDVMPLHLPEALKETLQ
jgi:hypothetical protein